LKTGRNTPSIIARPFQAEKDFWRVRDLLVATYPITPPDFNWDVRRWEGQYFYSPAPTLDPQWTETIHVWETEEGSLVGAAHREGADGAFIQVHPDYRYIEEDMIAWAEGHLTESSKDGQQHYVEFFVYDYDSARQRLLGQRGYEKLAEFGVIHRLRFGLGPLPQPVIAGGYTLRTTRPDDMADCRRIADLLNAAFQRDFHNAEEFHTFAKNAPTYRSDLDLVAAAPDGSFASYVGVPYEEINRAGIFEPVCTHPDHRRKGLAQALMVEALNRLWAIGAVDVTVATGDMDPANRLYDSIGFTEKYIGHYWRKPL
jgi:mycothiol synthase